MYQVVNFYIFMAKKDSCASSSAEMRVNMKRKVYILLIGLCTLFITGCNDNEKSEETKTQEYNFTLENPSMNIENNKDYLSSFYTNFIVKDSYRVYTLRDKTEITTMAIPDWQPEGETVIDTADFINMMDDEMFDIAIERREFLNKRIEPDGMIKGNQHKKEMSIAYKTPYIKEYTSVEFIDAGQVKEKMSAIGMWEYLLRDNNKVVDKFGVVCMSVNMYEGFYNHSNTTKLFIYGIPEEAFENGEKIDSGRYQYPNRAAILKQYHNGECQLDTLAEIELSQSGNYYMDFSEIIAKDEYKDLIIEMKLTGEITDEYTYAWYGVGYKIDNEQVYQKWKEQNKDKFIY